MGCGFNRCDNEMSIHTAKSASSAKLYLIAAVLMFIQTGVIFVVRGIIPNTGGMDYWLVMENLGIAQWVFPIIGVLFIIGRFFAKTGFGVTGNSFGNSVLLGYASGYALTTGGNNIFVG